MEAPQTFIIVFKEGVTDEQRESYMAEISKQGGETGQSFAPLLNGFSAKLTPDQLSSFQSNLQGDVIDYIEASGTVHTQSK